MSIYVDELRRVRGYTVRSSAFHVGRRNGHRWCHMMADSSAELDAFALGLGLRLSWRHGDHYDLTPQRRAAAVAAGAVETTSRALVELRRTTRGAV